jgi:hypothetical protein
VRGTRGEQRGDARDRSAFESDRRLLLRARVAPLVVRLQGGGEGRMRALTAATRAPGAHQSGQRERVAEQPEKEVEQDE